MSSLEGRRGDNGASFALISSLDECRQNMWKNKSRVDLYYTTEGIKLDNTRMSEVAIARSAWTVHSVQSRHNVRDEVRVVERESSRFCSV